MVNKNFKALVDAIEARGVQAVMDEIDAGKWDNFEPVEGSAYISNAERLVALTAKLKDISKEIDMLRADMKVEMLDDGTNKKDVKFNDKRVGSVRLVTEEISKIEVYLNKDPEEVLKDLQDSTLTELKAEVGAYHVQ